MSGDSLASRAGILALQIAAVTSLALVRLGLRFGTLGSVNRALEKLPQVVPHSSEVPPSTLAGILDRVDRRWLGHNTCLVRALGVQALCRIFGYEATLHVGVRNATPTIEAHAWVEHRDEVIIGGEVQGDYVPFPPVGDL